MNSYHTDSKFLINYYFKKHDVGYFCSVINLTVFYGYKNIIDLVMLIYNLGKNGFYYISAFGG